MEFTGERLVPGQCEPDLWNEHLARYCFAEPLARRQRVLDVGCGAGYGAARLAAEAASVFALDNSSEALRYARKAYPGVRFVQGDCSQLPFPDAALDLVVAFEVIEHLVDWQSLVGEAARVLAPSGVFLVSTPNRDYYRETRAEPNPFHIHEFAYGEFEAALQASFPHSAVVLQNHVPAIAFASAGGGSGRALFEASEPEPGAAHFFLGLGSREPLELPPDFAFVPTAGNVLRERERHVGKLERWVRALESRHAKVEGRLSAELRRLPYRILRRLKLVPKLPDNWAE